MNKITITFFVFFTFSSASYAEKDIDVINKVKQAISAVSEAKSLKEQSLGENNEGNNIVDQINRSVEDFDLGKYTDQLKDIASDNIPNIGLATNRESNIPTMRDPFNFSSQVAAKGPGGFNFSSSFLPNTNNSKIPNLKLRGVIHPKSNRPGELLALLEVDKDDVYMVRVGDEISYDPRNPNAAIKIIKINRLTVTVQAGSLGNVLIVR